MYMFYYIKEYVLYFRQFHAHTSTLYYKYYIFDAPLCMTFISVMNFGKLEFISLWRHHMHTIAVVVVVVVAVIYVQMECLVVFRNLIQ